ncbi:MAG: GNAT family N-acetyltransferase [Candidatus Bathyarchaeia archaeon]
MRIVVDKAEEDDVCSIVRLIDNWIKEMNWSWTANRDETIRRVIDDENHEVLVARIDGLVVGVLHQHFYLDILHGSLMSHIYFMLVEKDHRNKGVGSQLLMKAIENAKKRGVNEIHVDTIFEQAAKFYRKHGFKDDGTYLEINLEKP